DFATALKDAPPADALEQAVAADGGDLRARHLLGVRHLLSGNSETALEQFIEMLRQDRDFDGGLPRKALIDAFRVIDAAAPVGRYRRTLSLLLCCLPLGRPRPYGSLAARLPCHVAP